MEAQQIFDKVATHLATQGHRAMAPMVLRGDVVPELACAYRTPSLESCAFGCLIPDAEYDVGMEKHHAGYAIRTFGDDSRPVLKSMIPHIDLAMSLQSAHDTAAPTDFGFRSPGGDYHHSVIPSIKERLLLVAVGYRLDPVILGTLTFPEHWS